jgi:predicted homoserine dehydrogenase-like protein
VYGMAETASRAVAARSVPIGVVQSARIVRDVPQGSVLTHDAVVLDERLLVVQLRRMQDMLVERGLLDAAGGGHA